MFVCDLDGFKQVNDRFGHLQGNKLLQMFATFLRDSCREYDYAARMGGDEFVVVAPGLRSDAAEEMTTRLEAIMAHLKNNGLPDLSISIGQAFYPADGGSAEDLLAEADRRMYNVKRVHHAQDGTSSNIASFAKAAHPAS